MAKGDVSRYFHSFPLAQESRNWFTLLWLGLYYVYNSLPFGLTSCPYFTSAFTAEFSLWFIAMGITAAFLVDDWLITARTLPEAKAKMSKIASVFKAIGFGMAEEKFDYGQKLIFLGVLLDTTTMTMRIDPSQCKGFREQLLAYRKTLATTKHLDLSTLYHLSGKLNWFSEVVQCGRLHLHSLWEYQTTAPRLSKTLLQTVLKDLDWWDALLEQWANDYSSAGDIPILSGSEILAHPELVAIVQSDASGTDGFGYMHSLLSESDIYEWYSSTWPANYIPHHSHEAELRALLHYMQNHPHQGGMVLWVSDSESACWSVNKGHCKDPSSRAVLELILEWCDRSRIQLVALWVPRELNTLADHLSHLSFDLCRSSVTGKASY
jgi:hypothetical protein